MERNDISSIHGTNYKEMAIQVLEKADVASRIGSRDKSVALKPNLVVAAHPSGGGTTHSELLAGVIEYLQDHGFHRISIMEGS